MADVTTANYSWVLPEPGGSADTWGTKLNTVFTTATTGLDAVLNAVDTTAAAALPVAGGTMTGLLTTEVVREALDALAGTEIDWATGNMFTKTIAENTTFTFANLPGAGVGQYISVRITAGLGDTVTWPTVQWHNGSAPSQTSNGTDLYVLYCEAGTVYGARCLEDVS